MIKRNFKTAWRQFGHNRNYAAINIAGLAIAIAACVLIGIFVHNEVSFDNGIPQAARLYRLNEYIHYDGASPQLSAASGPPIAQFLKDHHAEIESYARVYAAWPFLYSRTTPELEYKNRKLSAQHLICTDTGFASLFGVQFAQGSKSGFLPTPGSIVLSQGLARKLFGDEPALNQRVGLRENDTTVQYLTVTAVIRDLPQNSHLQLEGILPIPSEFDMKNNYGVLLGPTYLKLRPLVDPRVLEGRLTTTVHAKNRYIDMLLQPVAQIHGGSTHVNYDYFNNEKIDGSNIRIFTILALAIFIIACCNFVNLTLAIAAYRAKEIAVKKILGAGRLQIVGQVLSEALLAAAIATAAGVGLSIIFLPSVNHILDRHIPSEILYSLPALAAYGAIILVTTLLAGGYPALVMSGARVTRALKNKVLFAGSRTRLRNILVTGQFAIAVVFVISLIVFLQQLKFLENKDLGYAYDQVIKVPLNIRGANKLQVLESNLSKIKGVRGVANGYMELGGYGTLFGIDYVSPAGKHIHESVNFENASTNYVSFFHMKILRGSDFSPQHATNQYLINETLARQIGYADPIGKPINLTSFPPGTVVGVIRDFNYGSLHTTIEPLIVAAIDYIPFFKTQLYIKVSTTDITRTLAEVESTLHLVFSDQTPGTEFLDEHFRQVYASEKQEETMIAIIGSLAVSIACLGLFGLAAFVMVKRAKEISIRKVLGASIWSLMTQLSEDFMRLVVIAFLIAAPIVYYLMREWLENFAYRIDISWWMFLLAAVLAFGVAFVTVGFIAVRAARTNPVKNLRSE